MRFADDYARDVKKMIDVRGETSVSESETPTNFKDPANNRSSVVSGADQVIEKKRARQSPRLNRPIDRRLQFCGTGSIAGTSDKRVRHLADCKHFDYYNLRLIL